MRREIDAFEHCLPAARAVLNCGELLESILDATAATDGQAIMGKANLVCKKFNRVCEASHEPVSMSPEERTIAMLSPVIFSDKNKTLLHYHHVKDRPYDESARTREIHQQFGTTAADGSHYNPPTSRYTDLFITNPPLNEVKFMMIHTSRFHPTFQLIWNFESANENGVTFGDLLLAIPTNTDWQNWSVYSMIHTSKDCRLLLRPKSVQELNRERDREFEELKKFQKLTADYHAYLRCLGIIPPGEPGSEEQEAARQLLKEQKRKFKEAEVVERKYEYQPGVGYSRFGVWETVRDDVLEALEYFNPTRTKPLSKRT